MDGSIVLSGRVRDCGYGSLPAWAGGNCFWGAVGRRRWQRRKSFSDVIFCRKSFSLSCLPEKTSCGGWGAGHQHLVAALGVGRGALLGRWKSGSTVFHGVDHRGPPGSAPDSTTVSIKERRGPPCSPGSAPDSITVTIKECLVFGKFLFYKRPQTCNNGK